MDNFDLKKYLAENELFRNDSPETPEEVIYTGTFEIVKTPKGTYKSPSGDSVSLQTDDAYQLYLDGKRTGDVVYQDGSFNVPSKSDTLIKRVLDIVKNNI
jgi:hypothetical protein